MAARACITSLTDLRYNSNPLDLAEVLAREGFAVDVFSRFGGDEIHDTRGATCISIPHSDPGTWTARYLWQAAGRYDVYIGVNTNGLLLSSLARSVRPGAVCVYYALELEEPGHAGGRLVLGSHLRHRAMRSGDIIVATGPERADLMHDWWPRVARPRVLFNAPLALKAPVGGRLRAALATQGRGRQEDIVLYHGSLTDAVAIDTILAASQRWRSGATLVVMAFGHPDLCDLVCKYAANCANVVPVPPTAEGRANVLHFVADAAVGIVLYRHTGRHARPNLVYATPNKLYDFMACGVPVVCSDNPSLQMVEREGWGICVDPDDPDSVAEAVDRCLATRARRSALARELFAGQYEYGISATELVAEIRSKIG